MDRKARERERETDFLLGSLHTSLTHSLVRRQPPLTAAASEAALVLPPSLPPGSILSLRTPASGGA